MLDWVGISAVFCPLQTHDLCHFAMTDSRLFDEIGAKVSEAFANSPASDLEKNVRALLSAFFERFDLVTRADFEVQKRVLERALARISDLEARLAGFEERTNPPATTDAESRT